MQINGCVLSFSDPPLSILHVISRLIVLKFYLKLFKIQTPLPAPNPVSSAPLPIAKIPHLNQASAYICSF